MVEPNSADTQRRILDQVINTRLRLESLIAILIAGHPVTPEALKAQRLKFDERAFQIDQRADGSAEKLGVLEEIIRQAHQASD